MNYINEWKDLNTKQVIIYFLQTLFQNIGIEKTLLDKSNDEKYVENVRNYLTV